MSKENIRNFVKAFIALEDDEKEKIIDLVEKIKDGSLNEQRTIFDSIGLESANTVNFAPTPGTCPTCGK